MMRKSFRRKRKKAKELHGMKEQASPSFSSLCDARTAAILEELKQQDYGDFSNIVFEGGGTKCLAYVGVAMVLEELGVLSNVRRFGGTSGGAIFAALLAIHYSPTEIQAIMGKNLKELIYDSAGMVSAVPNIIRKFGWHRAAKVTDFLKLVIAEKTGSADTTFWEVYRKFGSELCVVACNLSTMSIEYFHPKTTPDVSLAIALRASMSLPGLMQPVTLNKAKMKHFLVDGGIICNFPLHCFDGWFLSMKPDDSFFHNLGVNLKPFGKYNPQTVGFVVYSVDEPELMKSHLEARYHKHRVPRPDTALAKSRAAKCDEIYSTNETNAKLLEAGQRFLTHLREADLNRDGAISLKEFEDSLKVRKLADKDIELLFGKGFQIENVFAELDADSSGKVTFAEFLCHMQSKGVPFRAMMEGSNMAVINTIGDYASVMFETIANQTRKVFIKDEDLQRTGGIRVDYIQTCDFDLEQDDKEFLVKQGILGCVRFLKHRAGLRAKVAEKDKERGTPKPAETEKPSDVCNQTSPLGQTTDTNTPREPANGVESVSNGTNDSIESDKKREPGSSSPRKANSLNRLTDDAPRCSPPVLLNRRRRKQFFSDMGQSPGQDDRSVPGDERFLPVGDVKVVASIECTIHDNSDNAAPEASIHSTTITNRAADLSDPSQGNAQQNYSF